MKTKIFFASFLFAVLCFTSLSYSQVPQMINYQGTLTDVSGKPLNGKYNMTFSLYSDSIGGTLLGTETQDSVPVENGVFSVLLWYSALSQTPSRMPDVNLEVQVGSEVLSPRRPMVSVPFAIRSLIGGGWVDKDTAVILSDSTAKVGIGTSSPAKKLHIDCGSTRDGIRIDSDGDASVYSDITQKVKTEASVPDGKPKSYTWSLRKDGDFSGDQSGPTLELYAPKMGGGYLAPLLFKTNGDVVIAGANNATNGNVGIGTTTPADKLHVSGDIRLTGALRDASGNAGTSGQVLTSTSSAIQWTDASSINDGDWQISGNDMYSIPTGNVGIGTAVPDARLCVWGQGSQRSIGFRFITPVDAANTGPCMKFGRTITDLPAGKASAKIAFMGWGGMHGGIRLNPREGNLILSLGSSADPDSQDTFITVNAMHRVGINTANADVNLEVNSEGDDKKPIIAISTPSENDFTTFFGGRALNPSPRIGWKRGDLRFGLATDLDDEDVGLAREKMRITEDGRVGIGTTNPQKRLHIVQNGVDTVYGSDDPGIRLQNLHPAGDSWDLLSGLKYSGGESYQFGIKNVDNNIMALTIDPPTLAHSGCYVGIGTMTPQRPLHINDVMRLEPRLDFPSPAGEGDLCVVGSGSNRHIYCYLRSAWRQLD